MKSKRIFAIIGIVLLLSLYLVTLISAITCSPQSSNLFQASLFLTIVIPILIYGYTVLLGVFNKKDKK